MTKIIFKNNKAIGCEYIRNGKPHYVYANKEIILCAGVYGNPAILMRSGIGNLETLSRMGIMGVSNNLHVGKHVIDHPEIYIQHRCPLKYSLNQYLSTRKKIIEGSKWLFLREGVAAVNQAFVGAFLSKHGVRYPEYQLHFWPAYFDNRTALPRCGGFKVGIGLCYPKSEGRVQLNPHNILGKPNIDVNYLDNNDDVDLFIRALRHTRKILSKEPLKNVSNGEETPRSSKASTAQIVDYIYASVDSGYHSTSSCRMAATETEGVVDNRGKVFGVDGLRVVDASIFPSNVGCNPAATTMLVAHRLSQT